MSTDNQLQFTPGSVKAAMKGVTSSDLWKVPRERLSVAEGFNVRQHNDEYQAHVRAIADSMKANGFMQDKPIAAFVADEQIIVTDGHTRLAAYDLAVSEGMEPFELPVVTKPRGTSMEDLTVALVTSNSGRPLTPLEVGLVCKRLVDYGMEPPVVAKRLGLTPVHVNNLLDLVAAPKQVRDLVSTGKVSATLAIETLRSEGKEAAKVLAESVKVAETSGKQRATKKHVKAVSPKASKPKKAEAPEQQELAGLDDAQKLHEGLEKAAAFVAEYAMNDAEVAFSIRLLAHLTGLSEAEVEPYFDKPVEPVAEQQAPATTQDDDEEL